LYYTGSGIITAVGGRPVHRLREKKNPIPTMSRWKEDRLLHKERNKKGKKDVLKHGTL